MRKPRDFDAELQALTDKAKALKTKKQGQLGELVIAIGADALSIEQLAGALLVAAGAVWEIVTRNVADSRWRLLLGTAVVAAVALVWAQGAVGIF